MKLLIVLAFVAVVAARPEDDYSRYENFNVDEITGNTRLLKAYCECFLGVGKCTAEGKDFKKWIPEAIQDNCSKCSEKQKVLISKMIIAIQEQLSEEWVKLNKEFNPDSKYDEKLKEFLAKYGH
ncbi:ejaculatory bulb-specific protein 3-like [Melitaea cinxia]|uniref:ejaculatory bulb-specific protein 3-like n=1 Tax=Melitaea cinxia TaxID=113334 RepID=UPI001E27298E|nr:ejaculatory bulb-specific protein 3-like [Melitaea cinxia]